MKIYLTEVEYGRMEPIEDHPERYSFEPLIEVDGEVVARWRAALAAYDEAQAEMARVHQAGRAEAG